MEHMLNIQGRCGKNPQLEKSLSYRAAIWLDNGLLLFGTPLLPYTVWELLITVVADFRRLMSKAVGIFFPFSFTDCEVYNKSGTITSCWFECCGKSLCNNVNITVIVKDDVSGLAASASAIFMSLLLNTFGG